MLEQEYEYYEANKKKFLGSYLNKYIVIKNNNVLGVFQTSEEAIKNTIKDNELGTFLVQFVKEDEPHVIFRSRVGYV